MEDGLDLSFETLKADEVGRRLKSASGRFEVAAKVLTTGEGDRFVAVRLWVGSEPTSTDQGWSEPSAWSHTVYDDQQNVVAYGYGPRERDSWAMAEKTLRRKLGGSSVSQPLSDKFIWNPGDLEILSPQEAEEILKQNGGPIVGFKGDDAGYLQWLVEHPNGNVLNVPLSGKSEPSVVHRASCRTISGSPTRGETWTAGDYSKVCSNSVAGLVHWATEARRQTATCRVCNPN